MTHTLTQTHPAALSGRKRGNVILRAWALWRQRDALGRLDARMLDDLGLSAAEARTESDRPVWDAPHHWRA